MADEAAFLIGQQVAAVGALPGDVLNQAVILGSFSTTTIVTITLITADVLLQDAGNGVGAGEHRLALLPGNGGAADTAELSHH